MSNVMLPIKTVREGDKITKTCVEDIYKILNRVLDQMEKSWNNSQEIINSADKKYWPDGDENVVIEGSLIIGTGVSQPCHGDVFNEEIGNEIAFKKAKLNANIKKFNILRRVYNQWVDTLNAIERELNNIQFYIDFDIEGVREYNPDYLKREKNESKENETKA